MAWKHFEELSSLKDDRIKRKRLFSIVVRTTGNLSRCINTETIEKKVVVGSAIQKHGFRFHFKDGNLRSSDEGDSF